MDSGYAEAVVSEKRLGKENGPLAYASGPKIGWAWIRPPYGVERLCCLQIYRRGLAGAPVGLQLVGDALALAECVNTGSFERRHMDEHVLAAGSGLDEAVASQIAIPFHCALIHKISSRVCGCTFNRRAKAATCPVLSMSWGS